MRMVKFCSMCMLVMLVTGSTFAGVVVREPDPHWDPNVRDLRSDYIRSWSIFVDTKTDGILDPGDQLIDQMDNWWTPLSAGTQYNYVERAGQTSYSGVPFSQPADTSTHPTNEAYWLDREAGTVSFYMTYAQLDNADYSDKSAAYPKTYDYRWDPAVKEKFQQRNMYSNGYAMGWLINDYNPSSQTGNAAGNIKMDIFVHNGKSADTGVTSADYGAGHSTEVRCNPKLATSDDISAAAVETSHHLVPPDFNDINGNDVGYEFNNLNDVRFSSEAEMQAIVDSMEVREYMPYSADVTNNAINADDTPSNILANLDDGNGNDYEYQDAFMIRDPSDMTAGATFNEGETDGGVIAGLSGYDAYSQSGSDDDWGEQQVIRIDVDPNSLVGLTKLKFFDFGFAPGTDQVTPREIVFDIVNGELFYNGVAVPDNRIYIATVHVPEPISAIIIGLGGTAIIVRKRKK